MVRQLISLFIFCLPFFTGTFTVAAQDQNVASYDFTISKIMVNKAGKTVEAMGIDGGIPAPLIEAHEGDRLIVTFHNTMDVVTSVHWHGILLPPDQDGVPFLNTKPIGPGESFTFSFDIRHTGTFWYHSHTGLQEQRGLYGPIRLLPKKGTSPRSDIKAYKADTVVVWSDWSNEDPKKILRNLKRSDDYYALKKDSVQSWDKVIAHGAQSIKNRLTGSLDRMGPMDLSDVGYDAFLANGTRETKLISGKAGDTFLVRMINASASTYMNVEFAGGPMTIVSADGVDVSPVDVTRLEMGMAETYDILVTLPSDGAFELRATANDGTGYASAFIGDGAKVLAPDTPKPNPFLTGHEGHDMSAMAGDMDHANMDMGGMADSCTPEHAAMGHCTMASEGPIAHMTDYDALKSPTPTVLPDDMPVRDITLKLTGDMESYTWSFDNITLSESDRILIKKGERVRFHFINTTMMSHPLHLHGHFFRVLNGQGDYSPLKHTIDLPSMGEATIEFAANEEADWIFHCHNLYHMKAGMSRVISYMESSGATDAFVRSLSADDDWYMFMDAGVAHNQSLGKIWAKNNRYELEAEWEADFDGSREFEAMAMRKYDKYFMYGVSMEHERESEHGIIHSKTEGFIAAELVLPLLIDATLKLDTDGKVEAEFGAELQLMDRTAFEWEVSTKGEYRLTLDYEVNKGLSIFATQHKHYGFGLGVMARF